MSRIRNKISISSLLTKRTRNKNTTWRKKNSHSNVYIMHLSTAFVLLNFFATCATLHCTCTNRDRYCVHYFNTMVNRQMLSKNWELEDRVLCNNSRCSMTTDDVTDKQKSPACHKIVHAASNIVSLCCGLLDASMLGSEVRLLF